MERNGRFPPKMALV